MHLPKRVAAVGHGESAYNKMAAVKQAHPLYRQFDAAFQARSENPERAVELANELLDAQVLSFGASDYNTPLSDNGNRQSYETGVGLSGNRELPDLVIVSPYLRTGQTLVGMVLGWPELGAVETIVEERVREREHGLANLYNDWKVFYTLHPEQQRLHALEGSYWYRYPQGESIPDVRGRMRSEMDTLCADYPGLDIMIVTHHVSILSLVANAQGLDSVAFKELDRTNKPDNASITTLVPISDGGPTGSMVVESYNQKFYQEAA